MPIELKCIVCNKPFVIKNNRLGRAKYCSVYCKGVDKKFDASPGIKKNLLTILEEVSPEIQKNKNGPSKIRRIKCICDCGKITTIRITSFYSGYSRSCGCLPRTYNREYENKMPLSAHPIHRVWSNMIQRCTNPKNTHFNYYGGRGVSVCEEWRASFASFYQWSINNGWSRGLQLDKDIKGNGLLYSPETCIYVTPAKNQSRKKGIKLIIYEGDTFNFTELSNKLNISIYVIKNRIKSGKFEVITCV